MNEKKPVKRRQISDETRKKISEAKKGIKRKPFSDEWKLHLSESKRGSKHSEETKKKLSESRMGSKNPFYGKKHSKETIEKMIKSRSKTRGSYIKNKIKIEDKPIMVYYKTYQNIHKAVEDLCISESSIIQKINSKIPGYEYI